MRVLFHSIIPDLIIKNVTYWCKVQGPVCIGMLVIDVSNRKWDSVEPVLQYTEYQCITLVLTSKQASIIYFSRSRNVALIKQHFLTWKNELLIWFLLVQF